MDVLVFSEIVLSKRHRERQRQKLAVLYSFDSRPQIKVKNYHRGQ